MNTPTQLLFIGNSYTFCNDLPLMLEAMVQHDVGRPALKTKFSGVGGWTFEQHWNGTDARARLQEQKWDYVVLQEQTRRPYEDTAKFREYATRFHDLAKSLGAKIILYNTWAPEAEPEKQALLNQAYGDLARDLSVPLVPSGSAFELLHQNRRGIDPFESDRRHPSPAGTYLSACCFYAWYSGKTPVGQTANVCGGKPVPGCSPEQIRHLQELAWRAWEASPRAR